MITRHAIGSGRALFTLPGGRFYNATKPLEGRILDMDLFTAQEIARATPPSTEGMDAAALEWEIEVISRALKGTGLSQSERIALNEDRRVFRAARAALSPQP